MLALDGGEGAEEEAAGVGQDGSAAGRDAVLGKEDEDLGEKLIDVGRGGEMFDVGHEFGGEIDDLVGGGLEMGVVAAVEARLGTDGQAATARGGGETAAAGRIMGIVGLRRLASHGSLLEKWDGGIYPGVRFANLLKVQRLRQKSADESENAGS
jgi:hypothetical protein